MTNGQDADTRTNEQDDSPNETSSQVPAPHPDRSPENVLREVLASLSDNDIPHENAGVRAAFNFASPVYRKRVGGSFEDFLDQMTDPIHRTLVDFAEAERGQLRQEGDTATEKVVVTDSDGSDTTYEFSLSKVDRGKYEGCWMIDEIELVYVGASPDHKHMPVVEFEGVEVKCKEGDVLRDVLLRASGISPHNDAAEYANCNGRGLCGTCAVEVVDGEVTEKTAQEKRRLRLPPHSDNDDPKFRLACQCRVLSDLQVHKHEGTWGQHVQEYVSGSEEDLEGDPIRVTDEEYLGALEDEFEEEIEEQEEEDDEPEDLALSEETQSLLDKTEEMLDE